jgi:hypothetical protein
MSLSVVCWLWSAPQSVFTVVDVERLASMLRRHLHMPYDLYCITDAESETGCPDDDIPDGVWTVPMGLYQDHAGMRGGSGRSCFRRLRLLHRDQAGVFGPRILQLDLDIVITDDVTPLFDRPEPLVLYEQQRGSRGDLERRVYNPSMLLMDAGVLHDCWAEFDAQPAETYQRAKRRGWAGSDMAVITNYLAKHPETPRASWRSDEPSHPDKIRAYWRMQAQPSLLPTGTRAVLFYGGKKNSDPKVQARAPWILEHWR